MIEQINKYWWNIGHFNNDQRDYFIEILSQLKPKNILEIGWATGRSCITMLTAGTPDKMISIDIDLDYMGARNHAIKMMNDFMSLRIIESSSRYILSHGFLCLEYPEGIDFAFVDGDHSYEGALFDINIIYPHLSQNGIMIIDDYNSSAPNGCYIPEVNNAVNKFVADNNIKLETWFKDGKGFAIIKK